MDENLQKVRNRSLKDMANERKRFELVFTFLYESLLLTLIFSATRLSCQRQIGQILEMPIVGLHVFSFSEAT